MKIRVSRCTRSLYRILSKNPAYTFSGRSEAFCFWPILFTTLARQLSFIAFKLSNWLNDD